MDGLEKITNPSKCVAAMDLGTNSSRLLITDFEGRMVYRDVKHVALGDGLAASGQFCRQAMERAICSFMDFREMMDLYGVSMYRAIATAACRMSRNADVFLNEVKQSSGIDIEVISPLEEARLTLKGAVLNAPKEAKYLFVYDLGGGSTEVTFALNGKNPEILATYSVPLGARNAAELYDLSEYDAQNAARLAQDVRGHLCEFLDKVRQFSGYEDAKVIATSSTPLRLAAWVLKHKKYDKFKADGKVCSCDAFDEVIKEILTLSYDKRVKNCYIGESRAKVILAAVVIFQTIYQELKAKEIIASLAGAQEAIAAELLEKLRAF